MRLPQFTHSLLPKSRPLHVALVLTWCCTQTSFASTPIATYGTYFGGSIDESTRKVVTDSQGNVIVVGTTTSLTLPGTANAFQRSKATGFPNNQDVFIAKFDATGRTLLWATFLGGDADDIPVGLAVDPDGNVYVTGTTSSSNYPFQTSASCLPAAGFLNFNSSPPFKQNCTMGPSSPGSPGNLGTAFVSKVSPGGGKLLYSVGIVGGMVATALAVNSKGEAFVGATGPGVSSCVFLFRFNATGTGLVYGAFLGGGDISFSTRITTLVVDGLGNSYVGGVATIGIPTTANALQPSNSNTGLNPNPENGFVLEVDASGSRLLYGTWFGPKYAATNITAIAVGLDGAVYFAGFSNGTPSAATSGAYLSTPGAGYVAKLRIGAPVVDAFSFLPGVPVSMKLGTDQNLHLIFPQDTTYKYASLSTPSLGLVGIASTFSAIDVAPTANGLAWIAGSTYATSNLGALFATKDAFQSALNGTSDAFLSQFTWIDPTISLVGSSATGAGPFAAGQLVSVYGTQLGPTLGSTTQVDQNGVVTKSNGGTQVQFDGVVAPILYTGSNQVNVAIPCSIAGRSSTQVVVTYQGAQSAPVTLPLTTAAPGIFTADGSGRGPAAVLNQDYSLNGPANPAARGSAITFFATGMGVTSPCVDGKTYQSDFPKTTLPVVVGVGSSGAQVLYAGQAPLFITGAAQINVIIPTDAPTGSDALTLVVNGAFSQNGVTVAVK